MKKFVITIILIIIIISAFYMFYYLPATSLKIMDHITIEAGASHAEAKDFFSESDVEAEYSSDINAINLHKVGDYPVTITVNQKKYNSKISVVDTIAPYALSKTCRTGLNQRLEPKEFVSEYFDQTEVVFTYLNEPDFSVLGEQHVTVVLTDEGNNTYQIASTLYISEIAEFVTVEAGSENILTLEDFFAGNSYQDASIDIMLDTLDFTMPAVYHAVVTYDGKQENTEIRVVDSKPPLFVSCDIKSYTGKQLAPEEFVTDVYDLSEVSVNYKETPDFSKQGLQTVVVVLTDAYNNSAESVSSLELEPDTEAPVISGELNKNVTVNGTLSYRANITVSDNCDENINLEIDSSEVNLKALGIYTVKYSAVDSSGNIAEASGTVTVVAVDVDEVYSLTDNLLSQILTPSIPAQDKVRAIYEWIRANISYVDSGEKSDIVSGAYNALKLRQGDCYTFYSIGELLLTRAGIENVGVTRVGGSFRHYWSLVNIGDGWYHFDSCPYKGGFDGCMFTETTAEGYTAERGGNYYVYDKSLYPEVVK